MTKWALALGVTVLGISTAIAAQPAGAAPAAPTVTSLASGKVTAIQLARLIVPKALITKAAFVGDTHAIGSFKGLTGVGISSGVVLSSGSVATEDGYTSSVLGTSPMDTDGEFGTVGDADLDAEYGGPTHDAAVLNMTILPVSSKLTFTFVVATHEQSAHYNEGPGIFVNGQNCAVSGTPPVSDTVGNLFGGPLSAQWNDNRSDTYPTVFYGFSNVLTCSVAVKPLSSTTVKIAIADEYDNEVDSDVLFASTG